MDALYENGVVGLEDGLGAEHGKAGDGDGDAVDVSWPAIPSSVVKSAGRVLQILEFFDDVKREANVVEICRALGYPQSSTSVLLRSLVHLGYLAYSPKGRSYIPTSRVRVLGNWVEGNLFGEGKLIRLVNELNERTGHAIFLGVRNGLSIQYIHVVQARTSLRLHMTPGMHRPIATSSGGQVLLSILPDAEVLKLIRRINAERSEGEDLVEPKTLLAKLRSIRIRGLNVSRASKVTPGSSVVTMLLPAKLADPAMVLGVGGASHLMLSEIDDIIACMRDVIARCLAREDMS